MSEDLLNELEELEEDGVLDLEEQLERALDRAFPRCHGTDEGTWAQCRLGAGHRGKCDFGMRHVEKQDPLT